VLPCIKLASLPTAMILPEILSLATIAVNYDFIIMYD
jgi:hypothetical protein